MFVRHEPASEAPQTTRMAELASLKRALDQLTQIEEISPARLPGFMDEQAVHFSLQAGLEDARHLSTRHRPELHVFGDTFLYQGGDVLWRALPLEHREQPHNVFLGRRHLARSTAR